MNESRTKAELRRLLVDMASNCSFHLRFLRQKFGPYIFYTGWDNAFVNVLLIWRKQVLYSFINTCVHCWLAAAMRNLRINQYSMAPHFCKPIYVCSHWTAYLFSLMFSSRADSSTTAAFDTRPPQDFWINPLYPPLDYLSTCSIPE